MLSRVVILLVVFALSLLLKAAAAPRALRASNELNIEVILPLNSGGGVDVSEVAPAVAFEPINDDINSNWQCGFSNCFYQHSSQKPNGCCGSNCCYYHDYCCNDNGDCVVCSEGAGKVSIIYVFIYAIGGYVLLNGVGAFVYWCIYEFGGLRQTIAARRGVPRVPAAEGPGYGVIVDVQPPDYFIVGLPVTPMCTDNSGKGKSSDCGTPSASAATETALPLVG
jgi:hypothetical protein